MEMLEYFEMITNDAIQSEIANGLIPKEFSIEATADGWEIADRNSDSNEKLYITLELA